METETEVKDYAEFCYNTVAKRKCAIFWFDLYLLGKIHLPVKGKRCHPENRSEILIRHAFRLGSILNEINCRYKKNCCFYLERRLLILEGTSYMVGVMDHKLKDICGSEHVLMNENSGFYSYLDWPTDYCLTYAWKILKVKNWFFQF